LSGRLSVLVEIRGEDGCQFAFVRSLSEAGCVLEVETPPRLGSRVRVRFDGLKGSMDAPGFAQHAFLWRLGWSQRRVRRVAVKWVLSPRVS
jgi:hypothetical protein